MNFQSRAEKLRPDETAEECSSFFCVKGKAGLEDSVLQKVFSAGPDSSSEEKNKDVHVLANRCNRIEQSRELLSFTVAKTLYISGKIKIWIT